MNYYPWERSLAEKYFNEKVYIFTKTIKNIFLNFIHYEPILCDDRDPPWIRNKINKLINEKNTSYQFYIQKGKSEQSFQVFQTIHNMLLSATEVSKQQYYSRISKKTDGFYYMP